jgi:hypothetical protein
MQLTSDQARQLAYEKRIQVLEAVNHELDVSREGREKQIELSSGEKGTMNLLAFGIVGAVIGVSPEALCNPFVLLGLLILLVDGFFFGFWAEWEQRTNNIANFEAASNDIKSISRPYFDAYDRFITHEPVNQKLFSEQADAYVTFLEKHRELGEKPRFPKKHWLVIGKKYLWLYALGLVLLGGGLLYEYCLSSHDISGVRGAKIIHEFRRPF